MSDLFRGYNLRDYDENVRRFFLFGIPLFSGMMIQSLLYNLYLTRLGYQEDFIGQMAGLAPLASGLCAVPTGSISERVGPKPFLLASAAVMAVNLLPSLIKRAYRSWAPGARSVRKRAEDQGPA